MLTRVYIDNFGCFVNFEHKPARKQLVLGRNGCGKSSYMDTLLLLRQLVTKGDVLDDFSILSKRTRWLNQSRQTFEIEAELEEGRYCYRLVVDPWGEPARPRVVSETVHLNDQPIFEFQLATVHLYNDEYEQRAAYESDWHRSALATIMPRGELQKLSGFKRWLGGIYCFRINPFTMGARSEGEDLNPRVDLLNIASWYRHLLQADPKQNIALLNSLREVMDDFSYLKLDPAGENIRLLAAEFDRGEDANAVKFYLNQLSDGQRCLICLYTILHFVLAKGSTVIIDEPENFISLREIQPWLTAVADTVEGGKGQVLLISHHPEIINQWAPKNGVQFVRDRIGAVRVEPFRGDSDSCLPPAEFIARGWESE